jgi:hypothetical protein
MLILTVISPAKAVHASHFCPAEHHPSHSSHLYSSSVVHQSTSYLADETKSIGPVQSNSVERTASAMLYPKHVVSRSYC